MYLNEATPVERLQARRAAVDDDILTPLIGVVGCEQVFYVV